MTQKPRDDSCDVNVWLALTLSRDVHHVRSRSWFENVDEPRSFFFCRLTQLAYLRLLTNSAVLAPYGSPPLTNREAWNAYMALLDDDRVAMVRSEPAGIESIWEDLSRLDSAARKLWTDASLAAFAIAGGISLVTTDRAFPQFEGLDLVLLS